MFLFPLRLLVKKLVSIWLEDDLGLGPVVTITFSSLQFIVFLVVNLILWGGSGCQKAYHSVNDPFSTSSCLHIYRERYISPCSCFTPVVECCCMLLGSRYVVESGDYCSSPASVLCKSCIPGYNMWGFFSVSSFPYGSDTLSIFSWIGTRFSHLAAIGEDLALISLWILIPVYIKSCIWSRGIEGLCLALGIKGVAGPLLVIYYFCSIGTES